MSFIKTFPPLCYVLFLLANLHQVSEAKLYQSRLKQKELNETAKEIRRKKNQLWDVLKKQRNWLSKFQVGKDKLKIFKNNPTTHMFLTFCVGTVTIKSEKAKTVPFQYRKMNQLSLPKNAFSLLTSFHVSKLIGFLIKSVTNFVRQQPFFLSIESIFYVTIQSKGFFFY